MGCGGSQKSTSTNVQEAQRFRNKPTSQRKHPPSGERYKLDPEVLDGFAKVLKKGSEQQKPAAVLEGPQKPAAVLEGPRKPVKVEYQAPRVSNPFADMLKGEQSRAAEEHRHSPEPPRPGNASSDEDNDNASMEKERRGREITAQ